MSRIKMLELRFGYFPQCFEINNSVIHVKAIQRTTTHHKFHEFQVKGDDLKIYRLTRTLKNNEWKAKII